MPHYHVRAHWSAKNDWSGWVEAVNVAAAIAMLIKAIRYNHGVDVPETAEFTIRQGKPDGH